MHLSGCVPYLRCLLYETRRQCNAEAAAARGELAKAARDVQQLEDVVASLRSSVIDRDTQIQQITASHDTLQRRCENQRRDLNDLRDSHDVLELQLQDMEKENDELRRAHTRPRSRSRPWRRAC